MIFFEREILKIKIARHKSAGDKIVFLKTDYAKTFETLRIFCWLFPM